MGLVWERGCAAKEMGETGEKGRDNAAGVGRRADVLETRQWVVGPASVEAQEGHDGTSARPSEAGTDGHSAGSNPSRNGTTMPPTNRVVILVGTRIRSPDESYVVLLT